MKFNIITHITTACNYDCSYCDVIKDKKNISDTTYNNIIEFIQENQNFIQRFKFFWWEPLLAKNTIHKILEHFPENNNFEIVTNTTLLDDKIWEKLQNQFTLIFFSIDSENDFDFEKNIEFIKKYDLEKKLYFNIIVDPQNISAAKLQFQDLYQAGMRGYNFLPIYFTKPWNNNQLKEFSIFMKSVLDLSLDDNSLRLYGFRENKGYDASLINPSIFIDVDGKIYYSDFVSTFLWKKIKDELYLWKLWNFSLEKIENFDFDKQKKALHWLENKINQWVEWQKQLHKIMDYFSEYLNKKNGK